MDYRDQKILRLKEAVRAIESAVATVLSDTELAAAGGLDRLAPFSRLFRFALAEALVTGPAVESARAASSAADRRRGRVGSTAVGAAPRTCAVRLTGGT